MSTLVALALGAGCGDPVVPAPVATSITVSPADVVLEDAGVEAQLTATVRDQDGETMPDVQVVWTSSNRVIAGVSQDGLVTGGDSGTTTVTASVDTLTAAAAITVRPGQRAVLQTIYQALGGEGWENDANWMTGKPLNAWYGVYTDNSGKVTRLELTRNGLTGTIPPEAGELQSLEFVALDDNRVTGSIPPELGDLSNLRSLSISSNELTGSIPPELGGLDDLLGLYLFGNRLTGSIPPELGNLRSAYELDLSGNELTGAIPPELDGLDSIFELDLSENRLTGSIPPQLGSMGRRNQWGPWYLDLSRNQLTGSIPAEFGSLRSLRRLDLSGNELTGSIPYQLGFLGSLRQLDLSENDLAGSIPSELGTLGFLSVMDLSENDLTGPVPGALGELRTLTGFSIFANPLNGPLPTELIGIPLVLFHWYETDLCAPIDAAFQEWLDAIGDHSGNANCDSNGPPPKPSA